jgi:hypothetical protein
MPRHRRALTLLAVALGAATIAQEAVAAAPTAITGTVSAVAGTSATLNGTVNPGVLATDWWFEYGTSTSYGSKTPATAAGSGSANVAVSKSLSGLAPATTYHYRLVAKSAAGTTNGGDGLFTTAAPPVVVTSPATAVGPTTATLGGTVNPNGQATTWYVEYGTTTGYGTKTPVADAGSQATPKAVSVGVSGLGAGKTYHFRLVATSSAGTVHGADATFLTAEPPIATTSAASSIASASAKLNGKVDPNGRATTYLFEYGTTTSYGTKTSSSSAGSGANATSVSKTVTGLVAGTTYHFRLVATSDAGSSAGADQTFATTSPPSVATGQASAVGPTFATLGGSVNPNGRSTSWYVEYGATISYGSRTSSLNAGTGTTTLTVVVPVSSLQPGITYHFRLVATNSVGTSRGGDVTFTTTGPPTAATGPVTFSTLSLASARVNGTVNPQGLAASWWFEYGRTTAYGFRTAERSVAGAVDLRVSTLLTGLSPGVRWHYRVVARSLAGTSVGSDASFATPARPLDPSGRPVRCTIVGTQAAEVIRGTRHRDVICALGGNDVVLGGGGDDVIYGGPGSDTLNGGAGRDVLRGGAGNDVLQARDGRRDIVEGGPGNDLAVADRGLDRLVSVERRRYSGG